MAFLCDRYTLRFAVCYGTVVMYILSVTLVYIVAKRLDRSKYHLVRR